LATREQKRWRHYSEERVVRQARKQIKRNRKRKRVRQQNWNVQDWETATFEERERILPPGERERRRKIWAGVLDGAQDIDAAGTDPRLASQPPGRRGLVVEVSAGLCRVEVEGRTVLCGLRGTLTAEDTGFTNVVAVGDMVTITENGAEHGVVEAVLPRTSALARPDVFHSHLQQVVVANVAQLLVVQSWRSPALWPELVDRYLIAAERHALKPIICLNKVDLASDVAACQAALEPYIRLKLPVHFTSALDGAGVDGLREALRGRTTVLSGLSGVGKSSLIAAVQPGLDLRIAEVSERRHEGRHTTAQVNLVRLEIGGWVADTPGIREFGLSGLRKSELQGYYPELVIAAQACRYRDCSHAHEPGCAVPDAVRSGAVAGLRYRNYRKIYEALPD
jgi:ribosome biogenesis GTPase